MKYSFTLLLFCLMFGLNAQQNYSSGWGNREKVRGNGDVTTEERDVRSFDGIQVCCSLQVELRQGSSQSVRVEAESNLLPYIKTNVVGGRLEVGFKDKVNIKSNEKIIVYVTVPEIEYIGASSSSKVVSKTAFTGDELELDASSAAFIDFEFSGDRVRADASSGSKIELSGRGTRIKAGASSGAKVRAGDFAAATGNADASSGGGVTVNVSEELDANASSGGGVRYHGSPSSVDANRSSGGSVRKID